MSRQPRNLATTSLFHVITQGNNKNYIFDKPEDIKYYIKNMYKLLEEHNLEIIAYCIMNNHTHALIKTSSIHELSKFMQRLNTKYSMYYNKKYDRVGYVFRSRYKSEVIYDEKHLYNCISYIYNNPVKAGMCMKPEDYPYSNYNKNIYKLNKLEEYYCSFLDIEEDLDKNCDSFISKILHENNTNLSDLPYNKAILNGLVCKLYSIYGISLRKISQKLNINREKIRMIIKSCQ